jgi:PTH1 family peptidyl-tRNA hydrolase
LKLIIGLGNPGFIYRNTKHNIGASVVKKMAKDAGIKINKKFHLSFLGRGRLKGKEAVLAIPQTFMNLSGRAAAELVNREMNGRVEDLLVVCDDINLELGKIRLRKQGSSGGHKGLESIIRGLGRDDFARLRVGIATQLHKGDITRYVLSPFRRKERRNASHAISLAADAVLYALENGVDAAMSVFNTKRVGTS